MTGRLFGTRKISVEDIQKLVDLTKSNNSRQDIANTINCNQKTVYVLQKKLDLI